MPHQGEPPDGVKIVGRRTEVGMQERLLRLLREYAFDKPKYHERVSNLLKSAGPTIWMPKSGHLTPMQLISLLQEKDAGGFNVQTDFNELLRRLDDWGLANDFGGLEGTGPRLTLNDRAIRVFDRAGVLENCVWGKNWLLHRYAQATPAIIITKQQSEHIGTGSVVRFGAPDNPRFFLVTNRHVVDPNEGIEIEKIDLNNENIKSSVGHWHLCSKDDLAAAEIVWNSTRAFFSLDFETRPLDRVTTLGYPKIPFADDAYLAFHSGEVNTVFRTTNGEELFLISNQIGPGSSGGPVMNDKGLLVGVAAKAFQGKMEPDADFLINWNAAVTFKRVRDFLQEVSGIEDWSENYKEWLKD